MSAFHDFEISRSILESLPARLCVVDMQNKIVYWSDGDERTTGHLRHEVIGHSCITRPCCIVTIPDVNTAAKNAP